MNQLNQKNLTQQRGDLYPLTHPQKRVWYLEKLYPDTSLYNIGGISKATCLLDLELLEEALNLFIQRHDGLRLRFCELNGEARQYIGAFQKVKLDFIDFSSAKDPELELNKWATAEMRKAFKLIDSSLYYFCIFKLNNQHSGFLGKFHHLIADGWSINILCAQVYEFYEKLLKGEPIEDDAEYSYLEYLQQEQKYLNSERCIKNRTFWMEKFQELPEPIFKDNIASIAGNRITYLLDKDVSFKIKEFVTQNKTSLNIFFIALVLIYLRKISQLSDLVIGTPVLNRSGEKEKKIFGMFTSTMPFRFDCDDNSTVSCLIEKISEELRRFYFNQKYPYDLLAQDLELKKKGYDNLFEVAVNYYNTKINTKTDRYIVETEEFYNGNQFYLLQLVIKDWAHQGNLSVEIDYKINVFTESQIELMFQCLLNLIKQIINDSSLRVRDLILLPADIRKKQLYQFNSSANDYPTQKTIYQLFEEQVLKSPNQVAVSFGKENLTYQELNHRSNQLARSLRNKGVTRDGIVGLMVTHSLETVIGILGIIKAGGAYLPIDPEYPADRIEYMLNDSECKILLTNCILDSQMNFKGEIIRLDDPGLFMGDGSNLEPINKPEDLVYIIYTSGSTGKPKGVMIEHRGLVNYIWWAKKVYVKDEQDAFALYSSLSFDLTVTSIFTPLIGGNRIVVYRDDGPEYVLFKIMRDKEVSIIKLTPSHLSLLLDLDNTASSVKRFIVGGEDLKTNLAAKIHRSFNGDIEIYNEYGPTETVVGCMIHKFDYANDTQTSVPIGIPADNVQIYILDQNLDPLPEGSIGELYISGDGVARGYLNRPDLTEERFLENPYLQGRRMYKTGDLARFLSNGKIEYVGRADQQVKIHGYRIELGEIEKHLLEHHLVNKAIVIDRQNPSNDPYLCAYIEVSQAAEPSQIIPQLKEYLLKSLPGYMVPMHFVLVDEIPLTKNGKVNRSLLPEPKFEDLAKEEYRLPATPEETELLKIVREILGTEEIGMGSNFFHLGGDSIKAIQIAAKLNDIGLKIKVRDILSHPVITEMATCLERETDLVDQSPCAGSFKPTPIYAWFFAQQFREENHYNQSVVMDWKEDLTPGQLRLIMETLIKHHDSLRLNYNRNTGELFYNNAYLGQTDIVQSYDLTMLSPDEQDQKLRQLSEGLKSGFDIEKGLLIKAGLFNLGNRGKRVLLTAHHLVVDGVSWRILLEDIQRLYDQIKKGQELTLALKTHSLQEWSSCLSEQGTSIAIKERAYWDRISGIDFSFPVNPRPTTLKMEADLLKDCGKKVYQLSSEETRPLIHQSSGSTGAGLYELLITALVLTIRDFTGVNEVPLELEGHGREEIFENIDLTRTVGWFTSIYPALFRLAESEISQQIESIQEQLALIPHHGIGYGILQCYQGLKPSGNQKYIRFNYLGVFDGTSGNNYFSCRYEEPESDSGRFNHLTALIDINAMINNGQLLVTLTYGKDRLDETAINDFIHQFDLHLHEIITFMNNAPNELDKNDFEMVKLSRDDMNSLFV